VIGVVLSLQIHIPPGDQSVQGAEQSRTMTLMTAMAMPIFIGVVMMIIYSAIYFRRTGSELVDGPPMLGNPLIETLWVGISAVIVLFLAAYGITTLASSSAAQTAGTPGQSTGQTRGGTTGSSSEMVVQVIAQQWYFTYRYADYGGVETTHLYLPVDRPVELHVTSLDIIHSFWAYQLGVKADANPGVDNVFHVTPQHSGSFQVRCAELCGIWHGEMADSSGKVVSQGEFDAWIQQQQQDYAAIKKAVPGYAPFYYPLPLTKGS
jgi:cytochrome c oxidase subunit II